MLEVTPIAFRAANEYVKQHHRKHKKVVGCKFNVAVSDETGIRGVAIVGRPVARGYDDGRTLEVTRCCTDGAKNACSMLYGAAWRAAKALGYKRLITYTLPHEGGGSLRGAGWKIIGKTKGGNWNTPSRPREDSEHQQQKFCWEAP